MGDSPPRLQLRTDFTVRTWVREDGSASVQVIGNRSGRHAEARVPPRAGAMLWLFALLRALLKLGAWSGPFTLADHELAEDRADFDAGPQV